MMKYTYCYLLYSIILLTNARSNSGGWNAETYDNVSTIQQEFATKLIQLRKWTGSKIVIDRGCGSGRVTQIISKKVPNGKIYAVNEDSNMIDKAKVNLSKLENIIYPLSILIFLTLI